MVERLNRSRAYSKSRSHFLAVEIARMVSFTVSRRSCDNKRRAASTELSRANEVRALRWKTDLSRSPLACDQALNSEPPQAVAPKKPGMRAASADIIPISRVDTPLNQDESILRSLRFERRTLSNQIQQLKGICDIRRRCLRNDAGVRLSSVYSHEFHGVI